MATRNIIKVAIIGDAKGLKKTTTDVDRSGKKISGTFKGIGSTIKGALGAAGIVAGAGFLKGAIQGAVEDEAAQKKLAQALRKTAGATTGQVSAIERYISKAGKALGVTDDEMRPAFINLVNTTKDARKSQDLMNTALDISARTGKPLGAITMALGKAYLGSTGALGKLGIKTKDAAGKALSFEAIQAKLNKQFGGSAASAAATTEGRYRRVKVQFTEMTEAVGGKLLPVLGSLLEIFLKHQGVTVALVAALGGMFVIVKIVQGVKALREAILAVNVVMAANPAVAIALAIAALGAAIFIAYKKVGWFRSAVDKAWQILQTGYRWIKQNWPLLVAIITGPLGVAVLLVAKHWDTITGFAKAAFGWLRDNWPKLLAILTGPFGIAVLLIVSKWDFIKTKTLEFIGVVVGFFKGLGKGIGDVIGNVKDAVLAPFKAAFNAIADLWNNTVGRLSFKMPGWVPGLGGKGFDMPDIPKFHSGGTFRAAAGRGEGLAWLQDGEHISTPAQWAMATSAGGAVIVNMPAGVDSRAAKRAVQQYDRRNGRTR